MVRCVVVRCVVLCCVMVCACVRYVDIVDVILCYVLLWLTLSCVTGGIVCEIAWYGVPVLPALRHVDVRGITAVFCCATQ